MTPHSSASNLPISRGVATLLLATGLLTGLPAPASAAVRAGGDVRLLSDGIAAAAGTGSSAQYRVTALAGQMVSSAPSSSAGHVLHSYGQGGVAHTVTPSAGHGGGIAPATAQTVNHGSTVSFTVRPDTGYGIASVTGCGGHLTGDTYTTGPVTGACTVVARFSLDSYTVTPWAGSHGSIRPAEPQTVNRGSNVAFTVTPEAGYVASVGGTCGGELGGTTYTTDVITGACTVEASFFPQLAIANASGEGYSGETLRQGESRSFHVGGPDDLVVTAGVTRAGVSRGVDVPGPLLTHDTATNRYIFDAQRTGRYAITFTHPASGQVSTVTFEVHPQVAFDSLRQIATAGQAVRTAVRLSDHPIDGGYPVVVGYTVAGHGYSDDLDATGSVTIADGDSRSASIHFVPHASDGEIVLTLGAVQASGAVPGSLDRHTVILREAESVPLKVSLDLAQPGSKGVLVRRDGGLVTLTAGPEGAGYRYDWSGSHIDLGIHTGTGHEVTFDPSYLEGNYQARVVVTEAAYPNRAAVAVLQLRVARAEDNARIGAHDAFYGEAYEDEPHRLPICGNADTARVCTGAEGPVYLMVPEGYRLRLLSYSEQASWARGNYGLGIDEEDLVDGSGLTAANAADAQYRHLGYLIAFEVLTHSPGESVPVVVPLPAGQGIPSGAVWRKYMGAQGWRNFIEDGANVLHSAPRTLTGDCPWHGADSWSAGLNEGDNCVRITVEDGGPNDLDGEVDGVIRDPGTLATPAGGGSGDAGEPTAGGGGGGAINPWWLLLLIAPLCFRRRARFR